MHQERRHDPPPGQFGDDQEAAWAFDSAARRLRPKGEGHGAQLGNTWRRVNFPTAKEEAHAAQQGMSSAKGKAEVAAKAAAQDFRSAFVGVR